MAKATVEAIVGGRRCEVLGYGISGRPLVDWLLDHGASSVTVRDKRSADQMVTSGDAAALAEKGVTLVCGGGYLEGLGGERPENTVIFRSPGIRPDLPEITAAVSRGARLSSEMELFLDLTPATVVGITGSDGKTTTTTLISLLLDELTRRRGQGNVYLGGNIGAPLLPLVDKMSSDDFAVVELSSFQLMTMSRSPLVSVITNVSPNHLNWHADMEEYVAAKRRICTHEPIAHAVLNAGNAYTRSMGQSLDVPITWFSAYDDAWQSNLPRCCPSDTQIYEREGRIVLYDAAGEHPMLDISRIRLPGRHNVENYMAAIAASASLNLVSSDALSDAVAAVSDTFTGVRHRLELVREKDGVRYYNSSIDSSPTRTCAALSAVREMNERCCGRAPIVICGGQDKHVPFDPLARGLCDMASQVVLTGEAMNQILNALRACPLFDSAKLVVHTIPGYRTAMRYACDLAEPGDTVLLSPACTSFDAFRNFEERGDVFRDIVMSL